MKTAGVVFDFYDDATGDVLRSYFPTAECVPEVVKTAHQLTPEERALLRDDAFGLVAVNGGQVLRKFACVDAGNTLLSALYFERIRDSLPPEAAEMAERRILAAAERYDFSGLAKEAGWKDVLEANAAKLEQVGEKLKKELPRLKEELAPVVAEARQKAQQTVQEVKSKATAAAQAVAHGTPSAPAAATAAASSLPKAEPQKRTWTTGEKVVAGGGLGIAGIAGYKALKERQDNKSKSKRKTAAAAAKKSGMSRERDPMDQRYVGDEANWLERTNLNSVSGGKDAGRVMESAATMKTASAMNSAKAQGKKVYDSVVEFAGNHPRTTKGIVVGATGLKLGLGVMAGKKLHESKKENKRLKEMLGIPADMKLPEPEKQKQASIVDLTEHEAPVRLQKRASATHTALGGRFPLDAYGDVQAAVRYFEERWTEMDPASRHEFAVKTAARAGALDIPYGELLARYGSTEYAPDVEAYLASRKALAPDFAGVYEEMAEKVASIQPEDFAQLLREADEAAGLDYYWGGELADPWFSTFGGDSVVEKLASWSWNQGDSSISADGLSLLVEKDVLAGRFEPGLCEAFKADPTTIFDSLPDTQKHIIAGLAKTAAIDPEKLRKFKEGVLEELGPAVGATLAAGLGKANGYSPVASAALGYGLGSAPHLLVDRYKHKHPGKTVHASVKTAAPWNSVVKPGGAPMGGALPAATNALGGATNPAGGMAAVKPPSVSGAPKVPSLPQPGSGLGKTASIRKRAEYDAWDVDTGKLTSSVGGTRALNRGVALNLPKAPLSLPKPKLTPEALKGLYQKQGLTPRLGSLARK